MQAGCERTDGWLGFLISDKLYINFKSKRYTFENCMQLLQFEIEKICSTQQINTAIPKNNLQIAKSTEPKVDDITGKNDVESWNSDQLTRWLIENEIHQEIIDSFKKLDGACLKQLYLLNLENPQFVYQTLINEANCKLKLANVLLFMTRVKALFHNLKI